MKKLIALAFIALPLAACATLVGGGGSQTINMMTSDSRPAQTRIWNGGNSFVVTLPASVEVKRKNSPVTVYVIEGDPNTPVYSAQQHLNPWFWGNVILGGLIGSTTDMASGAAWTYDTQVIVPIIRGQNNSKHQNGW